MIVAIEKSDGSALCHVGNSDRKISVLSGGAGALLRRIAREPGAADHAVRLSYANDCTGSHVWWPSLEAAAAGIAAARSRPPVPWITSWR